MGLPNLGLIPSLVVAKLRTRNPVTTLPQVRGNRNLLTSLLCDEMKTFMVQQDMIYSELFIYAWGRNKPVFLGGKGKKFIDNCSEGQGTHHVWTLTPVCYEKSGQEIQQQGENISPLFIQLWFRQGQEIYVRSAPGLGKVQFTMCHWICHGLLQQGQQASETC